MLAEALDHLHYEFEAGPADVVEVALDGPANVQLLDPMNYENYRAGRPYHYHGGHLARPERAARIIPPSPGHWHLVIDLGGGGGAVRAAVRIIGNTAG